MTSKSVRAGRLAPEAAATHEFGDSRVSKRVTGQRSSGVVLDYVAGATLDDDPPLLEIIAG